MRPIAELSLTTARKIRAVFTDIDDTLTRDGRLEAPAFAAMWKLAEAGIAVVPVTGRPAGWCDAIARQWPVAGVVGENGAFYYRYAPGQRALIRHYALSLRERAKLPKRLAAIGRRVLRTVPGARIASDQSFRIHDLAIDFAEDVNPPLSSAAIDRIVAAFEAAGATAKVSSIHVNGWFGSYDKLSMIRVFTREVLGLDLGRNNRQLIYVGDSPNDEPAFKAFALGVGVANIQRFRDRLQFPPAFVTRKAGGLGFAEVARRLLQSRLASKGRLNGPS